MFVQVALISIFIIAIYFKLDQVCHILLDIKNKEEKKSKNEEEPEKVK